MLKFSYIFSTKMFEKEVPQIKKKKSDFLYVFLTPNFFSLCTDVDGNVVSWTDLPDGVVESVLLILHLLVLIDREAMDGHVTVAVAGKAVLIRRHELMQLLPERILLGSLVVDSSVDTGEDSLELRNYQVEIRLGDSHTSRWTWTHVSRWAGPLPMWVVFWGIPGPKKILFN